MIFNFQKNVYIYWDPVESFKATLKLQFGPSACWSPLYGEKSWRVFLKNLNFFSSEERKTWASWM